MYLAIHVVRKGGRHLKNRSLYRHTITAADMVQNIVYYKYNIVFKNVADQ